VGESPMDLRTVFAHYHIKDVWQWRAKYLAEAVDARAPDTSGHSQRVAYWACRVAAQLGMSESEQDAIYIAGLIHDVGKLVLSTEILSKPGPLTEGEWTEVRIHPVRGAQIIAGIPQLSALASIVRHHHERMDGTGYPAGLAGEAIPQGARILAACDAYDVMTSGRLYRIALPPAAAQAELMRVSGTQLDADCVAVLLDVLRQEDDTEYSLLRRAS